ncbi:MAG: signal peptide peptidase SppA [SAR202 cluster bacterium]|nr:signal peptide peptidase SppA [SAR202 cluster bacterium]
MAVLTRRGRIAVLEFSGTIGGAVRTSTFLPLLRAVERSRRYAALVLSIDSPGGTVAASEELYRAVGRVAAMKPVVAYLGGTGASGAYYIACAARSIVALPSSVVGSIGVIYVRPVLTELMGKAGVSLGVYKSSEHKDMTGFWRLPTPEEGRKFQGLVDDLYAEFVDVVAKARKMDAARVRDLATGEVFTGRRAQELGLVDGLDDLDGVVAAMAAELGISPRRVAYLRPRRPLFRRLFGGMVEELVDAVEGRLMGGAWFR